MSLRVIPFLLILNSCAVQDTTQRTSVEPGDSIVAAKSRCVDTLRAIIGTTKSIPPRNVYRDVGFFYQIQAEIDLRVHDLFPESLAVMALMPDDSLSLHILRWKEALDVSPTAATFSFLVKTTKSGTAYIRIVNPRENRFTRREIRTTGLSVSL